MNSLFKWAIIALAGLLVSIGTVAQSPRTLAQAPPAPPVINNETIKELEAGLAKKSATAPAPTPAAPHRQLDMFALLLKGGWFMLPLAITSILVVAIAIERWIALRNGRLMPRGLVKALARQVRDTDTFDPRLVYTLCLKYPSLLARVLHAMLLKIGRPAIEREQSIHDTVQREADKAYHNVRWISLASGVAPFLGLMGTVFGLIRTFHDTTQLEAGHSRAEYLATGIYEAMVTTLTGLIVAIPAAILAHYFESRIAAKFRRLEEFLVEFVPLADRLEGKVRYEIQDDELIERRLTSEPTMQPAPSPPTSSGRSSAIHGTVVAPAAELTRPRRSPERT
jgi:biopolymer transport protein ExbB